MGISVSALRRAQRAEEQDMRDKCRVIAEAKPTEWDEELLEYVETPATVVYEGRCGLNFGSIEPRDGEVADQQFGSLAGRVKFPVRGSGGVRRGHLIEILASVTDPDMVGAKLRVGARRLRSSPTTRKFFVEETQ